MRYKYNPSQELTLTAVKALYHLDDSMERHAGEFDRPPCELCGKVINPGQSMHADGLGYYHESCKIKEGRKHAG